MCLEDIPTIGNGVAIKASSIAGGGNGLWSTRLFRRNELITEYCGPLISHQKALKLRRQNRHSHIRVLNSQFQYIDGIKQPKFGVGGASFANDARDSHLNNAVFVCKHDPKLGRDRVYLKATRDLQHGEEVFVNYGRDYWKLSSKQTVSKPAHAQQQGDDDSPQQEEDPQQPAKRTRYAEQRHHHQQQQHQDAAGVSYMQPQQLQLPQGLHMQVRSSPRLQQRRQQQQVELSAAAAAQLAAAFMMQQQQQAMAVPVQRPGWNAAMPFPLGCYPLAGQAVPSQLGQLGLAAYALQGQVQQLQAPQQQQQHTQQVWQQQQLEPRQQRGTRRVVAAAAPAAAGGVLVAVPCGPAERKVPSHPSLGSEDSEDTDLADIEQQQQQQEEELQEEGQDSDGEAPAERRAAGLRQQHVRRCQQQGAHQRSCSSLYRRRPQRGVSGAGGNPYRRMYTNARG